MKCQIKATQRNTNLQNFGETGRDLQLCSFSVSHCTISSQDHVRPWEPVAVPKLQFSCNRSTAWKNSVATLSLQLPLASERLARQRWLPSRTPKLCHWPWNVNSTIRKAKPRNTSQRWTAFIKLVATYNFAASLFCPAQSLSKMILDHGCCSSPRDVIVAWPLSLWRSSLTWANK